MNNLHALRVLQSCCKVNNKIQRFARTNQLETFPRRSVVHSCFSCSNPWSAWASKRQYPGEALFIVVKVFRVVFLHVHVLSAGDVPAKRCYLLFPLQQPLFSTGLEEAMSWRSVVYRCKGCSSCFSLCPRLSTNECPRRSIVHCCKGCLSCFSSCPRGFCKASVRGGASAPR